MTAALVTTRRIARPLAVVFTIGALAACGGNDTRAMDPQLQADLAAAAQAPGMRQQFVGPAELGYGQGYPPGYPAGYAAPYPPPYPTQYGYPQAGYPAPYPQQPQRVVYAPAPAPTRRTGTSSGSGTGTRTGSVGAARPVERRNTQKGAIIGAATGAAIGVATSRDRVKGAAVGALGGAVLGGVIGHQIKTPRY